MVRVLIFYGGIRIMILSYRYLGTMVTLRWFWINNSKVRVELNRGKIFTKGILFKIL